MSEIWRDEIHERDRKEKLATYLFAMKEDLSEWIAGLMNISVNAETFMDVLDNGTHLCRLANMIQKAAEKYLNESPDSALKLPVFVPTFKERGATRGSFVSRDNVANFIRWSRELGIADVIMFESEDLVLHKFQKPVILTLLDVARRASKFDIEPPDLVIMEEQIDEEIALEQEAMKQEAMDVISMSEVQQHGSEHINTNSKPVVVKPKSKKQNKTKVKNFIPKNLDALVKETVKQCTCEDNVFPVEKIADGKYKIGENRILIFVRVMRNHVMVRVGGGWDTLDNFIQKHDPCRTGGRSTGSSSGRQRSRCPTPSHHDHDSTLLHSSSNTSVASSDSGSSTSSVSRLSPVTNNNSVLQGMVCVFGESGTRAGIVPPEQTSTASSEPNKRVELPAKTTEKRKNTPPSRQTGRGKGLGSRHNSLIDVRDSGLGTSKTKSSTPGKTPNKKVQALRATLQQADLTFNRARTSDAILSRSKRRETDSPSSVVKRRGNPSLSREASSENLRTSRPRSGGMRRKSVDERRKRSPEVRRRSAVSPVPARRRLEAEYDTKNSALKKDVLRKDLSDNNLMFLRSFSADTITRGRGARRHADTAMNSPTTDSFSNNFGSPSRIPVPVTTYGKPRGFNRTSVVNEGPKGNPVVNGGSSGISNDNPIVPSGISNDNHMRPSGISNDNHMRSSGISNGNHGLNGGINRCIHCGGESCTCDEGFIDGDVTRTPLRPTMLFDENDCQFRNRETSNGCHLNYENSKFLENPQQHNGDVTKFSGNSDINSEWREVMTDILNLEEKRISDKNL